VLKHRILQPPLNLTALPPHPKQTSRMINRPIMMRTRAVRDLLSAADAEVTAIAAGRTASDAEADAVAAHLPSALVAGEPAITARDST
jgi:hypothetical protein